MNYKYKSTMTKKKAFTLIELLIVIAIIGILFIVLVSKVDFATDKAKATGVQTDFRSFQMAFDTVAKENAGFNTFGWDTGDVNQNGKRDSYDEGDNGAGGGTAKNGIQDGDEVFTGHKVYDETFTKVYSLKKNGTGSYDRDALNRLETAINANLDPKLHITIADDGTITMANGAQDPWNKEYHGAYITNAEVDKQDRGAIVMYSDGANNEFGSEHTIANGIVKVIVPGNNKVGKDDYSLVSCYTYVNGYGEVKNITTGFSNNQQFLTGSANNQVNNDDVVEVPEENVLDGLFANDGTQLATWDELVEIYGLDINTDYGNTSNPNSYKKVSTSLYSVLKNNQTLSSATKLVLCDNLTTVGNYAFAECDQIKTIYLGKNFSNFRSYSLSECNSVEQFEVHKDNNNYSTIDGNLYNKDGTAIVRYATGKTNNEFTIESNVKSIERYAFENAKNLVKLTIPVGLESTQYYAFKGCTNLKDVYFTGNTYEWCQINFAANVSPSDAYGNPLCYNANLYFNNVLIEDLIIPSNVTKIKKSAFVGCGSIKNIYLHKEVTTIGSGAFSEIFGNSCPNLESIFYDGTVSDWMKITMSSPIMNKKTYLYCNNELISNLIIPSGITKVKQYTFAGCASLISISMSNTVTTIDTRAFTDCQNLQSIEFSDSLTTINLCAFSDCINLQDFTLPNSLKTIKQNAFYGCDSLVNITIPASVTTIEQNCIQGDSLRTITMISETPPQTSQSLMFGNTNISNLTIYVPENAVDVYKNASNWSYYKNRIKSIQ